jgi:hypothetical protein
MLTPATQAYHPFKEQPAPYAIAKKGTLDRSFAVARNKNPRRKEIGAAG